MKFLKPYALLIIIVFLASIVIGCDNISVVKTGESGSIDKEKQGEEPKEIAGEEIAEESKQEILAENVEAQSSSGQKNSAPQILITEPDSNDVITDNTFTIWWKAEDANNDKLLIKLEYQKGGSWVLIADKVSNDRSLLWDLGTLSNGEYKLRATVTDGVLSASDTKTFQIERYIINNT